MAPAMPLAIASSAIINRNPAAKTCSNSPIYCSRRPAWLPSSGYSWASELYIEGDGQRAFAVAGRAFDHCAQLSRCVCASAPAHALNASQLGVIVNENDPASVEIAGYYQAKRGIPAENVVRVTAPVQASITRQQFAALKQKVDAQLPSNVQVLAIAWTVLRGWSATPSLRPSPLRDQKASQ